MMGAKLYFIPEAINNAEYYERIHKLTAKIKYVVFVSLSFIWGRGGDVGEASVRGCVLPSCPL